MTQAMRAQKHFGGASKHHRARETRAKAHAMRDTTVMHGTMITLIFDVGISSTQQNLVDQFAGKQMDMKHNKAHT